MKIGRLLFLLCLAASAAHAQPGTPAPRQTPTPEAAPQQDDGQAVTTFIREVRVPVTVTDKKGVPVTGLLKSDFQVFEDKVPQDFQFIGELAELQKLPVYVAVLMDTSYSTAGKLKFEQEAALNFLHTVTRLRKDRAAFVTFDDEVKLRQDFTTNLDFLTNAVNAVKKPGLHTALYDAVWQFCDEKMRDIGGGGRRVIVLITDGEDTYSRMTLREAIEIAQQTDTVIFSLSTKGGFTGSSVPGVEAGTVKDTGDKNLEKLAEETGGRAFFTGDMLALERAFKRIGEELRSQYILSYTPSNKAFDGSRRDIEVKLTNKKDGYRVRSKDGYRATRDLVAP
ncbi:MAG TPA: VWA domain-containing protein [Pyrinomonadaceae bacterium]|jgi:Ca-activated chloride channel family protein|nr:VWA domain-containing protein [Pyrinomonadaceae bacterium]